MLGRPSLFVLGSFVLACSARVGRFPAIGESAVADHFVVEPGGKGFNLAVGAHRLGATVHSIFSIGDDIFAPLAEAAFARAGLTPTRLRRNPGQTGSGIGFIDATGETCVAVYPGANLELAAEDVRAVAEDLAGSAAVLAQFEIADAPIVEAFALARRAGVETILNPSPFRMPSAAILRDTSILVVNAVEARAFMETLGHTAPSGEGLLPPVAAEAVFSLGPQLLIVTRGPRGAIAYRRGAPAIIQPAFQIEALDSLGAGDAFVAAFAVGRAETMPIEACLRQGAAAGALATLRFGVVDALARRVDLQAFLAARHHESHLHSQSPV